MQFPAIILFIRKIYINAPKRIRFFLILSGTTEIWLNPLYWTFGSPSQSTQTEVLDPGDLWSVEGTFVRKGDQWKSNECVFVSCSWWRQKTGILTILVWFWEALTRLNQLHRSSRNVCENFQMVVWKLPGEFLSILLEAFVKVEK